MPVTTTLTEEITATSHISSDEAIRRATARATARLREVEKVAVKGPVEVLLEGGNIVGYRVTLEVTHAGEAEPRDQLPGPGRIFTHAGEAEPRLPLRPSVRVPLRTGKDGVVRVGRTRVPLDTVVAAFHVGETAEEIVEQYPSLRLEDVYLVLGYYLSHRDAVDAYVAQREGEAALLREIIEADFDPTGLRARLLARRAQ